MLPALEFSYESKTEEATKILIYAISMLIAYADCLSVYSKKNVEIKKKNNN